LAKLTVDQSLDELRRRKRSLRCSDLCGLLKQLGYEVHPGKAGHKTYDHPALPEWIGSNFDCGHGKDGVIKLPYVVRVISIVTEHSSVLKKLRGET
jgi:hypothetical protein